MPILYLHRIFHLRTLWSLAAQKTSHVTAIALTCTRRRILEGCFDPGHERTWFLGLVPLTALTGRARLKLLLPGFSRNLVELFKKKRVHWKTPSFFKAAHDVLFNDFFVSGQ